MPIDYAAVDAEIGPEAHNVSRICFAKFRFISSSMKEDLRRTGDFRRIHPMPQVEIRLSLCRPVSGCATVFSAGIGCNLA